MAATVHHHHTTGIGLGTLVAVLISWSLYKSIGWAILHGFLGWIYVIYWAVML